MPTGFTHELLSKKQTFPQFALTCARAFGAYIHMREDGTDALERPPEPSTYHVEALKQAKRKLTRLKKMSDAQFEAVVKRENAKSATRRRKGLKSDTAENAALSTMAERVRAWQPPTSDHTRLKEFMLQQIEASLHDFSFYDKEWFPVPQSREEAMAKVRADIAYHEKERTKDLVRHEQATKWIAALKESLT